MAVRKVMRMGHPVLRQTARPLTTSELHAPDMPQFIQDMVDTLHDYGGIGLAAPQIGEPIRLLIIEMRGGSTRYGELAAMPLTVYINPEIEVLNPATAGFWEGCLSVPGLRGFIERPQHLGVRYIDLAGKQKQIELKGFQATCFQHEFDHLNGRLYIDRITDLTRLAFDDEYMRYHTGDEID